MSGVMVYPCDAGTGWPMGYHNYVVGPHGTVCSLCGAAPTSIRVRISTASSDGEA